MDQASALLGAGQHRQAGTAARAALRHCERKGDRAGARRAAALLHAADGALASERGRERP
jgi:hypothetical protein